MKKWLVRWLVVALLLPGIVYAQAVTATQRAVAATMERNMAKRGFAANDPRWVKTLQSSASAVAGAAASAAIVTAIGVTAPAWITVAGTVALGALIGVGIDLAIDGIRWMINKDGSVTVIGGPSSEAVPLVPGAVAYLGTSNCSGGGMWGSTVHAAVTACAKASEATFNNAAYSIKPKFTVNACTQYGCSVTRGPFRTAGSSYSDEPLEFSVSVTARTYPGTVTCPGGMANNVGCYVPPADTQTKTATDAVAALSEADKGKPANPVVIAQIADSAYKKAASQPGYEGIPYDEASPVTAADASAVQAANPTAWPTVGDITAPQASPSGGTGSSPWDLPSSGTSPGTTPVTPPAGGTETPPPKDPVIDWSIPSLGDAPGKTAVPVTYVPTLFAAPTGCPAPVSFTMYGKAYSIAYAPFCDLMATLAPLFLACGAAAAALIFAESLKS